MADPQFDTTTGRWYIRYHVTPTDRTKKLLPKHDGWKKSDRKPKTVPPQVVLWARPYQDLDASAKLGHEVKIPRARGVVDYLAEYTRSYALANKPNSQKALARAVKAFLEYCVAHDVTDLHVVDVPTCRNYVEARKRAGAAYATIKGDKALLGAAWSRAVKDRIIDYNPWRSVDIPGKDESKGTPCWTESEVGSLLGVLEGWARDVFVVGINCGFRCEAIRHMQWGWIDWTPRRRRHGLLNCPEEWSKSGKAYTVPLFPDLHDVLARRLAEAADGGKTALVFPGRCADGGINASGFHQRIEKASKAAGVEWRGHAWHAMRSTFATRYLEKGFSPRAVQAWMSHSSLQMTDKYLSWSGEAEDNELDRLIPEFKPEATDPPPPNP